METKSLLIAILIKEKRQHKAVLAGMVFLPEVLMEASVEPGTRVRAHTLKMLVPIGGWLT